MVGIVDMTFSRPRRVLFLVAIGGIVLLLSACTEEWGSEVMPTGEVAGRVHRSGEPLTRGWLEFMPVDGTVGRLRSARIERDGTFQADSVPIGRVAIRMVGADLPGAEFLLFSQLYLIRRDIGDSGTTTLEIDLAEERQLIPSR